MNGRDGLEMVNRGVNSGKRESGRWREAAEAGESRAVYPGSV